MGGFTQQYSDWLRGDRKHQSGVESIDSLIDWLKSVEVYHVTPGYQYDCEIRFDEYGCETPNIAFSVKTGKVSVFPYSDFISPSFISVSGDEGRKLADVLNVKVKQHLGLV